MLVHVYDTCTSMYMYRTHVRVLHEYYFLLQVDSTCTIICAFACLRRRYPAPGRCLARGRGSEAVVLCLEPPERKPLVDYYVDNSVNL